MFEEINNFKIRVHNSTKKTMAYVPNIISMGPLDDLFNATEWLFTEAVKDYTETNNNVIQNRKANGYSQKNLDAIDELSIRLGSRMQGYVNQLCLMEDILIYEYDRMSELIKEASGNKIIVDAHNDYEPLKKRFASIRTFRNKVVAHTAYTYPKINKKTGLSEDNPETVVRSILNLFPEPCGITLGGNFFSGFSEHRSQIPIITIFNWEEETRIIFQDWKELFIKKLTEIHKLCPLDNKNFRIDIANTHLTRKKK